MATQQGRPSSAPVLASRQTKPTDNTATAPHKSSGGYKSELWWEASANSPLRVVHVGVSYSARSGDRGISILFSSPLALNQNWRELIQVRDAQGSVVQRDWLASRNPNGIYMPALPSGRYKIRLEPRIQDTQGRMLKMFLEGPITIP